MAKNFAIIGVGGYIAPRHLEAIKVLGHNLIAAFDPNDSVGIMDRFFPACRFFTSFELFEAFIEDQRGSESEIHFVSICSPNYLHHAHIRFALRMGAKVICEKPIVLTSTHIEDLITKERESKLRVFTVLQLRVHEKIKALKNKVEAEGLQNYEVNLEYITSRGDWYLKSWKADVLKSGGLSSNIGVHFFDMLTWIFGEAIEVKSLSRSPMRESGYLVLQKAKVNWTLSIDMNDVPLEQRHKGKTTFRELKINGESFEFSDGFTELHQTIYQDAILDKGFSLADARAAIKIVERLREAN